jgi:hypothetical protein
VFAWICTRIRALRPGMLAVGVSSLVFSSLGGWATTTPERIWVGPEGHLLPFTSFEEIEQFLSTAQVVGVRPISSGITRPYRLTLEKDGVRMNAIFRYVNIFKPQWESPEGLKLNFRDSCYFEVAAYRLSRLLGFGHVPPAVVRTLEPSDFRERSLKARLPKRRGTLQAWVEDARTEKDRREAEASPPNGRLWLYQYQLMTLFDALTNNEDRNQGNILIGPDWTLWFIDSTRAFRPVREPRKTSGLRLCKRRVWDRLRSVTDAEIRSALKGLLNGMEVDTLLARRAKLVDLIEGLIRERGETSVLYDLDLPLADPPPTGAEGVVGASTAAAYGTALGGGDRISPN